MALNSRVLRNAKLNKFNLSHTHTTSADMGYLFPVDCLEVLPGDWFRIRNEYLVRFMATLAPVMHIFNVSLHWWFVPTRLPWKNWQDFITGGEDGENASVPPTITAPSGGFAVGSLANRLGAPAGVAGIKVSALPFRCYALIYNEWYRNEWLQEKLPISLEDGNDTTTNTEIQKRLWNRDYFTDALPSPQKGPAVSIPLGGTAPVLSDGVLQITTPSTNVSGNLGVFAEGNYLFANKTGGSGTIFGADVTYNGGLKADLSQASAVTINQLRYASSVMQFQEANGLFGNRYSEFIPAQYGVYCPDASLQRPQYVGGMTSPMVISEVLQTSATDSTSPQGNMAGHGVSAGVSDEIRFRATEFGYLMCLMSIMPKTSYYQGIPRWMSRETRFDYAIPLFAHIGEQGIKNKELYADGTDVDDEVFGYAPRYEEYRRIPNMVSGQLTSTLSFWTAARKFANRPTLNSEFVECTPTTAIFAVEDQPNDDHLVIQVAHHIKALRPLPAQGQPGMHII
uniref:Major capsid protein n=1 Tax=Dulem virus 78 TaxID=3145789 RepID=A0AAU8B7M2_9VIRU